MAVVQISRIQHRSGVSDNLPQLARGEIGLSVDTRKVYIGNGGSDAPQTENIEILTSLSSLIESSDSYTYSDEQIGFSAQNLLNVIPEVVKTHDWYLKSEDSGQYEFKANKNLGVYYSDLIPVLTKAIQEQQLIIDGIKAENQLLKDELESIKSMIIDLKKD